MMPKNSHQNTTNKLGVCRLKNQFAEVANQMLLRLELYVKSRINNV